MRDGASGVHQGLTAAVVAGAMALGLLTPSCRATVSDTVEDKAHRFLAGTKMSESDRSATAGDLARLCADGRISGC